MPRRKALTAVLLFVGSLLIGAWLSFQRWPEPAVHDEFSYLLAADTFLEGRLTNPPHQHWPHFESFHVIQQPTYASKYPPGQGLMLALGKWLTGQQIAGVWLMSALAAMTCYWMLLGWTSPHWAAVGALLYLVHPGYQLQWGQTYWGGGLAFIGGALVFGAAFRLRRRMAVSDAVAMAGGAVILAYSRPFEGLVFCLLTGLWVVLTWLRQGIPGSPFQLLSRTMAPQAAILAVGLGGLLLYHKTVTEDPFTFPYVVHERAYAQAPMFHGQPPAHPAYRHAEIEKFHSGWAMDWYRDQQSLIGCLNTKWRMTKYAAGFFVPGVLAAPLVLWLITRKPGDWGRAGPAIIIALSTYLISLVSLWNFPHYTAPVAPLLMLMAVAGVRYVDVLARRLAGWRYATPVLVGIQACIFAVLAVEHAATPTETWAAQRAAIEQRLELIPGRDLVFVRYGPDWNPRAEWVYNRADIDRAEIVWAREIHPQSDAKLVRYFGDRTVWLLEPSAKRLQRLVNGGGELTAAGRLPSERKTERVMAPHSTSL